MAEEAGIAQPFTSWPGFKEQQRKRLEEALSRAMTGRPPTKPHQ
jgi:hypothetical protein